MKAKINNVRIKIITKLKVVMLEISPKRNSSKAKFLLKFSLNKTAQDTKKYDKIITILSIAKAFCLDRILTKRAKNKLKTIKIII